MRVGRGEFRVNGYTHHTSEEAPQNVSSGGGAVTATVAGHARIFRPMEGQAINPVQGNGLASTGGSWAQNHRLLQFIAGVLKYQSPLE